MNSKIINETLERAVEVYGKSAQIDMIQEECIELSHAICKLRRKRGDSDKKIDNLIDELADVKIMMMQADIIFKEYKNDIDERIDFKINRLIKRMNDK